MIRPANPSILYFGTPVILVSTRNADATFNIAPLSSVFWLGWRCVIGVAATSKTTMTSTVDLAVPAYSQMLHSGHFPQYGGGGQAWCSPTSTAMAKKSCCFSMPTGL